VYICVLRGTHADRCCVHYNSGAGEKENNPSGKPSTFDYGNTTPPTNLPYIRVYIHIHIHTFFPLATAARSCPRPSSCPRALEGPIVKFSAVSLLAADRHHSAPAEPRAFKRLLLLTADRGKIIYEIARFESAVKLVRWEKLNAPAPP